MFCSSCGNPNDDAARYCERCGQPLEVAPTPMVSTTAPEDPGTMRGAPASYNVAPAGNAPGYSNAPGATPGYYNPGPPGAAPGYYNPAPPGAAPGYYNPGPPGAVLAPYNLGTMRGPNGSLGAITAPKDPATAASRALWFSCFGLGQFYNDDATKGLFVMALWWAGLCTGGLVTVVVWIWAFQDARDVASGIKPKW